VSRTVVLTATVVLALVAACMAALVVAVVKPAEATFPGKNGKIAFYSGRGGDPDIYVMNPNGSGVQLLTVDPPSPLVNDVAPAWSADGTKIAFSSTTTTFNSDIYSMNADGSNRTQLTNSSDLEGGPTWSPDGSRIAYVRSLPAGEEQVLDQIYLMDADGSDQVPLLADSLASQYSPAWSPDGSKIAFVRSGVGGSHIYTVNVDGSGLTKLTTDNRYTRQHPDWSPDGSKIVYDRFDSTDVLKDIIVMNSDGTGEKNITSSPDISEVFPAWSPNGKQIVYSRDSAEGVPREIWRMRANGTKRVQLTDEGACSCSWQPRP
jgi:Tol biopolymer transport system component